MNALKLTELSVAVYFQLSLCMMVCFTLHEHLRTHEAFVEDQILLYGDDAVMPQLESCSFHIEKSMQRSGTEAIRTKIQPSKPKREISIYIKKYNYLSTSLF